MANNITKLRGKHQIAQNQLAEKIGVTKQCLCKSEQFKTSLKLAKKIANELDENVFDVLGSDALVILPTTKYEKNVLISMIEALPINDD